MNRSFHRKLADRLLRAAALTLVLGPTGCDGSTVVEDDGAGGEGQGGNGDGGSGNSGNQGGAGNTGNDGGAGNPGGFGGGGTTETSCVDVQAFDVDGCPAAEAAAPLLEGNACGQYPYVLGGPSFEDGLCCYIVQPEPDDSCGVGRPYLVGREGIAASAVRAGGWTDEDIRPDVRGLDTGARRVLADAWLRDALLEHASVASFGRFALELMAVGAPADLLAEAHRAALDEIEHARMCFALASAYAGARLSPAAFPFGGSAEVRSDLPSIAAAVVREGCVGETLAAAQAAAQLERATDPAVRRVLAAIVEDESRHAELAWRTVAWAMRAGGEEVRRAVEEAFTEASTAGASSEAPVARAAMNTHGRLAGAELDEELRTARREVVAPCAAALLYAA
ncbi:MAG: ferritin-like domain-containing protein [Polyangiaceae bacterium]